MPGKIVRVEGYFLLTALMINIAFSQIWDGLWEQLDMDSELAQLDEITGGRWWNLPPDFVGFNIESEKADTQSPTSGRRKTAAENPPLSGLRTSIISTGDNMEHSVFRAKLEIYDKWDIGLVSERDPGEDFGDFNAYYLGYRGSNIQAYIGNYSAGFGQGLVLWRGFDWGAYPERPIAPVKNDFLRGYYSTGENSALVGGAVKATVGAAEFTALYSDTRWDASVDSSGVVSLQLTGRHVTPSELENADRMREMLGAAHIRFSPVEQLSLGFSASSARYSPPFAPGDPERQTFDLAGNRNVIVGTDWRFRSRIYETGGEIARCENGGAALTCYVGAELPGLKIRLAARHFDRDFRNIRGVVPEGNKEGISGGVIIDNVIGGTLNGCFDIWRKPWRTYNREMPPEGHDESLSYRRKFNTVEISLRLRRKVNSSLCDNYEYRQVRFNIEKRADRFSAGCRLEKIHASPDENDYRGYLLSWWMIARAFQGELRFRITGFDCPDYSCRIYQYEPDVPGLFKVPFYYGSGKRLALRYRWDCGRGWNIAAKAAWTSYTRKSESAAGLPAADFSLYLGYNLKKKN